MSNRSVIILLVVVAVLVVGGLLFYRRSGENPSEYGNQPSKAPAKEYQQNQTPPTPPPTTQTPSQNTVTYNGSSFSPAAITVKSGDTVTWINNSSAGMWVASAVHPTHSDYPTKGGCIGSTFDACRGIPPGSSWSFKFDIKGKWGYHDHLNPIAQGTVVVK